MMRPVIPQGAFYVVTGFWPLLSYRTFEAVTGPKRDVWLVKTVGLLIAASGAVLVSAGLRKRVTPEIRLLGQGHALLLGGVSAYYSLFGNLRKIYLLDAATEFALAAAWQTGSPVAAPRNRGKEIIAAIPGRKKGEGTARAATIRNQPPADAHSRRRNAP